MVASNLEYSIGLFIEEIDMSENIDEFSKYNTCNINSWKKYLVETVGDERSEGQLDNQIWVDIVLIVILFFVHT